MVKQKRKGIKISKWGMWKFFESVPSVRPHLPPTRLLKKASLRLFLSKYYAVYVKPNFGQQGRSVVKAWKTNRNDFAFIREKGKAVRCKTIDGLYRRLKTRRVQIVQKSINLAKVNGRPFDVRVLMMRDGKGEWKHVGMLAKAAGPGWIITNKRSHGSVLTVDEALHQSLAWNSQQVQDMQQRIIRLGHDICKQFDVSKRQYKQIGIDIGIDTAGELWIIEANVDPGWTLFAKLNDRSMYNHIQTILKERAVMKAERKLTEGAERIKQNVIRYTEAPKLKEFTPEEQAVVNQIFRTVQKHRIGHQTEEKL